LILDISVLGLMPFSLSIGLEVLNFLNKKNQQFHFSPFFS
jgi:hypothetical protein